MKWMMSRHAIWPPVASLFLVVAVCGCEDPQIKIQDLTAENEELRDDLADRDRQVNDALVREDDAKETINELQRDLAMLRAEQDKIKDIGGWVSTPTFDMISISDDVLFASGKAKLTSAGRTKLRQIASDIHGRYANRDIYVFGHTDAQPIRKSKWQDNWELGAQRALMVVRTFKGLGIAEGRLIAASAGQHRPVADAAAVGNQPRNRRVEVFAVRRAAGMTDQTTARGYADE